MSGDLTLMGESPFDAIRRTDGHGEYWSARDLMPLLGYTKWERFEDSIDRARLSIANSGMDPEAHASRLREASGKTERANYRLSRYGAYITALNGDVRKAEIADAQQYFVVKAREAETAPVSRAQLSPRQLAEMVIAEADRADAAEARAAEMEPVVAAFQTLTSERQTITVGTAAKYFASRNDVSTGRNRLYNTMRRMGWVFLHGQEPTQRAVDADYLEPQIGKPYVDNDGESHPGNTKSRVTAKGMVRLAKEFNVAVDQDDLRRYIAAHSQEEAS